MTASKGAVAIGESSADQRPISSILLVGEGVASRCCAHLLARRGLRVRAERKERIGAPALLLSDSAIGLIRDVFGDPRMFSTAHRIERRIVAWGGDPVVLPHKAMAVSEAQLLEAFPQGAAPEADFQPDFVIDIAPPASVSAFRRFGERRASVATVELTEGADSQACWVEALGRGWLFLIPTHARGGWLLAVGGSLELMLAQSRIIGPCLRSFAPVAGTLDASPRLRTPLQADGWLACGGAAMAFDPICGDGTAHAVRESILASAVVGAIADGGDRRALCGHYESMLTAAMRRHLRLCMDFYQAPHSSPWWDAELSNLADGYGWCTERLAAAPEPAYVLRGFDLAARES